MHKNARLTPKGREVMLVRLRAGQHQLDVAQAMGVSLTTLKKWLRRYRTIGLAGLLDRSSRPARSPRQLPSRVRAEITDLRRQRRTGRFIARHLGVSGASVSRILRRAHLSRWRERLTDWRNLTLYCHQLLRRLLDAISLVEGEAT